MSMLKIMAAFAVGAGCGIFAAKTYFEDKYKKLADEEIQSVVERYRKKTEDTEEKEKTKKQYHKEVENYISSAPLEMVIDRDKMEAEAHPEDDDPIEQFQITSMDYFDDSEYDKQNLIYYANDDTLVGPSELSGEDILDVASTVGEDAIALINNGFDDGSALYIRNPKTKVDYEITKSYISYKEMMLNE